MKGQKEKDRLKYIEPAKTLHKRAPNEKTNVLGFSRLDLIPLVFNRDTAMKWLAESGWIEGMCIKYLGDQFPYLDDYIQEIYILIFDKIDHLVDIYEDRGILAFCGYVKAIVQINCFADGSKVYKNIRKFSRDFTLSCDTEVWNDICDTFNPEQDKYYKFNKTNDLQY